MKTLLLLLLTLTYSAAFSSTFKLESSIHHGKTLPHLTYSGPGPWDNYLAMNLPFEPMAELFKQLLLKERKQLTNRGEAHITVITPVEFWNVLRPQGVTIEEINAIATSLDIQSSSFEIRCVGKGQAELDKKMEETFFVVVKSSDLIAIRKRVQDLFVSKGGAAELFQANYFFPHITLGFTKRDLHESDGVFKGEKTCMEEVDGKM